jgi:hypothetical protein
LAASGKIHIDTQPLGYTWPFLELTPLEFNELSGFAAPKPFACSCNPRRPALRSDESVLIAEMGQRLTSPKPMVRK